MRTLFFLILLAPLFLHAQALEKLEASAPSTLFFEGEEKQSVLICAHGYGGDCQIAQRVFESGLTSSEVIGFNFPSYGLLIGQTPIETLCFGRFEELTPLLIQLKECALNPRYIKINLYGFSSGGGALINALALLNQNQHDNELKKLGITQKEKTLILKKVQKGRVFLDCPLKSVEEIIALRGSSYELEYIADVYRQSSMKPIEALRALQGLSLDVIVHFQENDHILSNRDDDLYIERLSGVNQGKTAVIIGKEGEHTPCLPSLVQFATR